MKPLAQYLTSYKESTRNIFRFLLDLKFNFRGEDLELSIIDQSISEKSAFFKIAPQNQMFEIRLLFDSTSSEKNIISWEFIARSIEPDSKNNTTIYEPIYGDFQITEDQFYNSFQQCLKILEEVDQLTFNLPIN